MMKLLNFISLFLSLHGKISLISSEIDVSSQIVDIFSQITDHSCSKDLSADGDNLLSTWKLTSSMELYSLNFYNLISEDRKCKWHRYNKYCLYELYNESLTDGFLFALCIPPSCNETDVEILGEIALHRVAKENTIGSKAMIQCSRGDTMTTENVRQFSFVMIFTVIAALTTIFASIIFEIAKRKEKNGVVFLSENVRKVVEIFSDQVNTRKLTASNYKTDINILHPMRAFCMMVMIFCHVHELTQVFAKNAKDFSDPKFFLWLWNNSTTFVGTFFVIGGTLANYVTLCKYAKGDVPHINGKEQFIATIKSSIVPWSVMIVNRYIRLIFLYVFFILLFSFVMQHLVFFIPFVNFDPLTQCPSRIMNHIFMISNFDYRPYCMLWAWYLDVDFQLYVLTRPVAWLYIHKPYWAFVTSIVLVMLSSIIRIFVRIFYDLPPVMSFIMQFPGYNLDYLLNNLVIYTKPYAWLSSYAIGMIIGYAAFYLRFKHTIKLNSIIQLILWICSISFFLWGFFGIYWNANGYKNSYYDAFYITFSPLLWSIGCGWVILYSHVFTTSTRIQNFSKFKVFTFLSNLSLGSCLINFPIAYFIMSFYAFIGYGDPKYYLTNTMFFIIFVATCLSTYFFSYLLYLIIEGPAGNIRMTVERRYAKTGLKTD